MLLDTQIVTRSIFNFQLPPEMVRELFLLLPMELIEFAFFVRESSIGSKETPVRRSLLLLLDGRLNVEFLAIVDHTKTFIDNLWFVHVAIILVRKV